MSSRKVMWVPPVLSHGARGRWRDRLSVVVLGCNYVPCGKLLEVRGRDSGIDVVR